MVLKEAAKYTFCNNFTNTRGTSFAIFFQAMVLKGISGAGICLVFYNRLGNILA